MITIKYRDLKFVSILCLSMMSIVFFIGWLKAFIGVPLALLLLLAVIISRKPDDRELKIRASYLAVMVFVVIIWLILAGQGGFFTQKPDHWARNVIFRDLISHDWPVVFGGELNEALVYYIGHWMVPAIFGKIGAALWGFEIGYLIGRIALLLWTSLIVVLTILNVMIRVNSNTFKKLSILMIVFIFFSGMDAIASLLKPETFAFHLEWWASGFQYSSMSTQLFWVFNQAVPAWLAASLILNEKDESNYALIGLIILSSSPLPIVGLAVYLLALALVNMIKSIKAGKIKQFIKNVFSVQNILAVITILPVYGLYYLNNVSSSTAQGGSGSGVVETDAATIVIYIVFILFEFLILSTLLINKKNKASMIVIIISLLIIPFIRVGGSIDFCMRASIPALFILMVYLIEFFTDYDEAKAGIKDKKALMDYKVKAFMLAVIFVIGSLTAFVEFGTSIRDYIESNGECITEQDIYSSLEEIEPGEKGNFVGRDIDNSPFFKYLAK